MAFPLVPIGSTLNLNIKYRPTLSIGSNWGEGERFVESEKDKDRDTQTQGGTDREEGKVIFKDTIYTLQNKINQYFKS